MSKHKKTTALSNLVDKEYFFLLSSSHKHPSSSVVTQNYKVVICTYIIRVKQLVPKYGQQQMVNLHAYSSEFIVTTISPRAFVH